MNLQTKTPTFHHWRARKECQKRRLLILRRPWRLLWSRQSLRKQWKWIRNANGFIVSTRDVRTSSRTPMEGEGTMTRSTTISNPSNAHTALRGSLWSYIRWSTSTSTLVIGLTSALTAVVAGRPSGRSQATLGTLSFSIGTRNLKLPLIRLAHQKKKNLRLSHFLMSTKLSYLPTPKAKEKS